MLGHKRRAAENGRAFAPGQRTPHVLHIPSGVALFVGRNNASRRGSARRGAERRGLPTYANDEQSGAPALRALLCTAGSKHNTKRPSVSTQKTFPFDTAESLITPLKNDLPREKRVPENLQSAESVMRGNECATEKDSFCPKSSYRKKEKIAF